MGISKLYPRMFRPSAYQGKRSAKNYFEGWYSKLVSEDGSSILSIIFGISFSEDSHAFIQTINGSTGSTEYFRFPMEDFHYSKKELYVRIADNVLRPGKMILSLENEQQKLEGEINFDQFSLYPQSLLSPSIMGWYAYVPFMECYHSVVSMNHKLEGSLSLNNKTIDFNGGKGYIEKDWGKSMPSDWIWMQCNHFAGNTDSSLMLSLAHIPWLTSYFPGFLSFLSHEGKVYRFATYNASKVSELDVGSDGVKIRIKNRKYSLIIEASKEIAGVLKAPVKGEMNRRISESIDARIEMKLLSFKGEELFRLSGEHAGLEIVGDVSKYFL